MSEFGLRALLVAAVFVGAGWVKPVSATLIGDTVTAQWLFPDKSTVFATDVIVVGVGPEISCTADVGANICAGFAGASAATFDIGAGQIRFDLVSPIGALFSPGSYNGFLFSGLDWQNGPGALIGFQLTTSFPGLTPTDVEFGADFISIDLLGESIDESNEFFQLDLIVKHGVPEPGSAALLLVSLTGLFVVRRRGARHPHLPHHRRRPR